MRSIIQIEPPESDALLDTGTPSRSRAASPSRDRPPPAYTPPTRASTPPWDGPPPDYTSFDPLKTDQTLPEYQLPPGVAMEHNVLLAMPLGTEDERATAQRRVRAVLHNPQAHPGLVGAAVYKQYEIFRLSAETDSKDPPTVEQLNAATMREALAPVTNTRNSVTVRLGRWDTLRAQCGPTILGYDPSLTNEILALRGTYRRAMGLDEPGSQF